MAAHSRPRPVRWYSIPVRVLLVTLIGTLLCFAVSLLLAILGTVMVARLRGIHPDMTVVYRHIALPVALVAGAILLVVLLVTEIRHYRETKMLNTIERIS